MSTVRISKKELAKRGGRIDRAKVLATTKADIERYQREDDEAEPDPASWHVTVPGPDVRALREGIGLTQDEFADRFGLSLRTLQQWEQRRRVPDGPARLLLRLIEVEPALVNRVAHGGAKP